MEKLFYRYEVKNTFEPAIHDHYMDLRCVPMTNALQQVYGSTVFVDGADYLRRSLDAAGNVLISVKISKSHTQTHMVSEGVVYTDVNALKKEALRPGFLSHTALTSPDALMTDFFLRELKPRFSDRDSGWEKVLRMNHAVFSYMTYMPLSTQFYTPAGAAFSQKKGVCQDYAQILITFCRMTGIPARYAAGFLYGEGATHAWAEIYDNGYWYGFDPTHDRTISDHYIKVAHGRDAADCPLDRGVYRGITKEDCQVLVKVETFSP